MSVPTNGQGMGHGSWRGRAWSVFQTTASTSAGGLQTIPFPLRSGRAGCTGSVRLLASLRYFSYEKLLPLTPIFFRSALSCKASREAVNGSFDTTKRTGITSNFKGNKDDTL